MDYRILLVDDEADILEFVGYNLRREGYQVYTAANGAEAVRKAAEVLPHLILLDVMMPEMDGYQACREIRRNTELSNTVIAFLSARGEEYSQIAGFEAGGDDYITKPVKVNLLVSRVKALLKRADSNPAATPVTDGPGPLVIDRERFLIIKDGREIVLPRKEFNLLEFLSSQPHRVFSREEIFKHVWGTDVIVGDRTIDVHIRKLREKIGDGHIATVKGVGYKYI